MDRLVAMETFVRVVDTGSFSAAARQLRIGQPAVSKAVAQLENRLGVRLLLRSSRGLATTEAGQGFYERVRRAIEEADEAELAARGAGTGLSGRLRFSAAVTFARLHVIPRLPSFLASHPALTVEAILDDRNINPVEEGIDVALRIRDLADSALTARKIGESRRLVLGAQSYFAETGEPTTPADLSGHRAVVYARGGGGDTWTFHKEGTELKVALRDRVRMSAAEGGQGRRIRRPRARSRHGMDVSAGTSERQGPRGAFRLDTPADRPLGGFSHRQTRQRKSPCLRRLRRDRACGKHGSLGVTTVSGLFRSCGVNSI